MRVAMPLSQLALWVGGLRGSGGGGGGGQEGSQGCWLEASVFGSGAE